MDRSLSSNHLRPPVLWPLPKGNDDIHCENRRLIISGRLPGSRMSRPASIWELGKKETAHARGRERGRASERERERDVASPFAVSDPSVLRRCPRADSTKPEPRIARQRQRTFLPCFGAGEDGWGWRGGAGGGWWFGKTCRASCTGARQVRWRTGAVTRLSLQMTNRGR